MSAAALVAPRSGWIAAWGGCLAVAIIVILAIFGRYTQHVTAAGRLVPSHGLLTLTAVESGELKSLHVQQGQAVLEGQVIAEISGELSSASMGGTYASLSAQLLGERDRLRNDLDGSEKMFSHQQRLIEDKMRSLTGQLRQINQQAALQRQHYDINQRLLEKMESLSGTGYVSELQILQQKGALLEQNSQIKALGAQELVIRQQFEEARNELDRLPLDAEMKRNAILSKIADLEQRLVQNEVRRAYVIRAPRDGVVSAIMVDEGQAVQVGQPIIAQFPSGSEMQAQLFVASRQVGFIRQGSPVLLRLQAFPYQDFGQIQGVILEISHSALSPDDVQRMTSKQFGEPQYQVRVSLDKQAMAKWGGENILLPGMMVDASIILHERRLIEWFFEPLHDFKWRFQ